MGVGAQDVMGRVPAQDERTAASTKPFPHKFTLVFDREGYSPEFMARMKAGCIWPLYLSCIHAE